MSQITDVLDGTGTRGGGTERALGIAVSATSEALLAQAKAALEGGASALDAVRACLPGAPVLAWPASGELAAEGHGLLQTSYRGHVLAAFDREASRAALATLRLADELPLSDEPEDVVCHSLLEAARRSHHDVRAGLDADALLGGDVETRIASLGDRATPLVGDAFHAAGEAVIVIDALGNVAIATTGPEPVIIDRSDKPFLACVLVGEPVLALATFTHAVIDRALSPEEAMRAPRMALGTSLEARVEQRLPPTVRDALAARGHTLATPRGDDGLLIAVITHELYREAVKDPRLPASAVYALRGDPPAKVPMPARGQNFTIGAQGHKE